MKWFFTDFDGTLRNSRTSNLEITATDLCYVRKLQQQGRKLIVATGRPYSSISNHLQTEYDLYPDFYIGNAGATITNQQGEVLFAYSFEKDQQDAITNKLIELQDEIISVVFPTATEENMLFDKEWSSEKEKLFMEMRPQGQKLDILFDKTLICFKVLCQSHVWKKVTNWLEQQPFKVNLTSNNVEGLTFSEIHPQGITKGNAIRILQKQYGFADKDVIVVGDDNNNLSMFKEFYENSYVIEQDYNLKIQTCAKTVIRQISEIDINRKEN